MYFYMYFTLYICSVRANSGYKALATLTQTQFRTKSMNLRFDSKLLYIYISVSNKITQLLFFCSLLY